MPEILERATPGILIPAGSLITPGGQPGPPGRSFTFKGTVTDPAELPPSGNQIGDIYLDTTTGHAWVWDGTKWDDAGPGLQGPPGLNAYTNTAAGWTVPAVGATANLQVDDARWIAIGQFVWLAGAGAGGDAGAFKVTDINDHTVTLLNPESSELIAAGLLSSDVDNLLSIGSDGLLYLAPINVAKELISTDEGNISVIGSDGLIYTPGVKELELDLDLYVPLTNPGGTAQTRFTTIQEAWNHLKQYQIPINRQATIHVDQGIFDITAGLDLFHPNGDRISIIGADPVTLALTGGIGGWTTAAAGNWRFRIVCGTAQPQIAVGDVISLFAGGTTIYGGAWNVVTVESPTSFLLQNMSARAALATVVGTPATAGCRWYPTRLVTGGRIARPTIEIGSPGLGLLQNISILDRKGPPINYDTIRVSQAPARVRLQNVALCRGEIGITTAGSACQTSFDQVFIGNYTSGARAVEQGALAAEDSANSLTIGGCVTGLMSFGGYIRAGGLRVATCSGNAIESTSNGYLLLSIAGWNYSQYNFIGLSCTQGSFLRSTGVTADQNANADIQAINASTVLLSDEQGASTFTNVSPALNTLGNKNSIIIR